MKTKILSLLLGLFLASSISAMSSDEERLIEKAMTKGAVTTEQKHAISQYFQNIANRKTMEAKRYKEIASLNYGGKALQEEARKREYRKLAESLEEEAKFYERLAIDSQKELKVLASN
ncbi:MAG: hypothetical protein SFU98_01930 [Leptospiraceae bacterium]|nr:hypothetical protein [Leptospiraceae bacterium]